MTETCTYQDWLEGLPLAELFTEHPDWRSITMLVAQYWNDEAEDEMHYMLCHSSLPEPDIAGFLHWREWDKYQDTPEPTDPNLAVMAEATLKAVVDAVTPRGHAFEGWDRETRALIEQFGDSYSSRDQALFRPWASPGSQEALYAENYLPCVTLYRDGTIKWYEQARPFLFGESYESYDSQEWQATDAPPERWS